MKAPTRYVTGLRAIEAYVERIADQEKGPSRPTAPTLLYSRTSKRIEALITLADAAGVRISRVDSGELDAWVGGGRHRGVVLEVPYVAHSVADFRSFLSSDVPADAVVLALDGVTDPHNLGAVLRSADQFGVDLVVLPSRRSARLNDTVLRTSAGAALEVPLVTVPNLPRALADLKEAGCWVYGADVRGDSVVSTRITGRVVLVLGSEGEGMGRLVRESCDFLVRIPAFGTIDSLNVSVAAGVLLYEIRRRQGLFDE